MSKRKPNTPSKEPVPPEGIRLHRLIPVAAAVLTFFVFMPALKNGFVSWDDLDNIVGNQKFRGLGWEQLKWMFTTFHMGPYQPLSWMTYGLDYLLWGLQPFGYHLTNVILHSLNAFVFCLLFARLLVLAAGPGAGRDRTGLALAAVFAALFFSVHPLRVESVSWATERRDVLFGLFYLLALLWYARPRSDDAGKAFALRANLLPLAAFLLSLLAKGMAISLPIVLVVLDIYPLRRLPQSPRQWLSPESRAVWLEKIPYFALAAVFGAAGYFGQAHAHALTNYENPGSRAAQILFATGFYIWKTFIPLALSPLYQLPAGFGLTSRAPLLGGALALAITLWTIAERRRRPAIPALWVCYLAALAPVSGIVKFGAQAAADRYTYLPCMAFAMLAGAGFWACRQSAVSFVKDSCVPLAGLVIAVLIVLSLRQEKVWLNSETLWLRALAVNPGIAVVHSNLGAILTGDGRSAEAFSHYMEAVRIDPASPAANNNLGSAFVSQGNYNEAVKYFKAALQIKPDLADAHFNLALALVAQNKLDEAVLHYREALRLGPDDHRTHTKLSVPLMLQGKFDEALVHCREAIRFEPEDTDAYYNMGLILSSQRKLDEAAASYREALRIDPNYARARSKLGLVLANQGRRDEAIAQFNEALRLDQNDSQTRGYLAIIMRPAK